MKKIIFILSVILFSLIKNADGQLLKRESLVGLDSIRVSIVIDVDEIDFSNLENSIKNKYELRLQRNNISIAIKESRRAVLFYKITGIPVARDGEVIGYGIDYELLLTQWAFVNSNGLKVIYPYTWTSSGIVISSIGNLRNEIRTTSEEVLDEFLNDYLSVN